MAVGYNAATAGVSSGWTASVSWSHTVSSQANRILLVGCSAPIVTCTYGGVSLAAVTGLSNYVFWLINPASGAATTVVTIGGAGRPCSVAIDFYGVDQLFPFRDTGAVGWSGTTGSISLSASIGDMMVGMFGALNINNLNCADSNWQPPCSAAYDACSRWPSTVASSCMRNVAHGVATTSPQTMTYQNGTSLTGTRIDVMALRPYIPAMGRGVKYYFNIWDPRATVRDRNDRPVPPNELRADCWVELQGVTLPDPKVYTTYVEDPTKAYIVEVTASDRGASLRASRNQFADTLIKRAAAGRG